MNNELKFRSLRADEIDVRIGQITKGGVSLLLYKDARCDQNILDETVGAYNWQRHHTRDNANCVVAIRNKETGEWVEKEDTGVESFTEKEKGLASDSFKRACFNWGIGRELYTAPKMFIFKEKLKNYKDDSEKPKCYDTFKVEEIVYKEKFIEKVTIGVYEYGKRYNTFTFSNEVTQSAQTTATSATPTTSAQPKPTTAPSTAPSAASSGGIADDEIILIGNCKGKKYSEVKDTEVFNSFLKWAANAKTSYPDPQQQDQFNRFKALAS